MAISHCLLISSGQEHFTLLILVIKKALLTCSGQEWQFYIATLTYLKSSGQE